MEKKERITAAKRARDDSNNNADQILQIFANIANTYTLLLDSGGSGHDMSNPAFQFNIRPNPDANVPIKTIMGVYHCKKICTTPFLGKAGSNDSGNLNIISLGKLQNTPNIEID